MRLAIAAVLLIACGGAPARTGKPGAPQAHPERSEHVRVVVEGGDVRLNGIAIGGKPTVAQIADIVGKPDRTWDSGGMNKVHTWDKLGLLVYEPYRLDGTAGDGRCISATFTFKPMSQAFSPKQMYDGWFTLDGKRIHPKLVLSSVAAWPGATQPYTPASIVFDRGSFHVFTVEERRGTNLDLVELSFWQNARGERPTRVTDVDEDDCKAGDVSRCSNRALVLQTGAAGRKNLDRAFELVKFACEAGDAFACVMLGNMHEAGKGRPAPSPADARVAWQRACTLGYRPACTWQSTK